MGEQACVCGIPNNVDNCERCRLIAQLTAAQQRVAELQTAIRALIATIRINCPNGNSFADCYDIPTYTGTTQAAIGEGE